MLSHQNDRVWVSYTLYGEWDDSIMVEERRFRNDILGANHWSAQSTSGLKHRCMICVSEEIAMLFKLKFKEVEIRTGVKNP